MTEELAILAKARADDVNKEISKQWRLLKTDDNTRLVAERKGVDLKLLDEMGSEPPIEAKPVISGNRSDVMTAIAIGIAVKIGSDVGKAALDEIWTKLIKPQIERTFGKTRDPESGTE